MRTSRFGIRFSRKKPWRSLQPANRAVPEFQHVQISSPPIGRHPQGEKQHVLPIGSMYAIYGIIYHQYTPNVSIYTIHGSYVLLGMTPIWHMPSTTGSRNEWAVGRPFALSWIALGSPGDIRGDPMACRDVTGNSYIEMMVRMRATIPTWPRLVSIAWFCGWREGCRLPLL